MTREGAEKGTWRRGPAAHGSRQQIVTPEEGARGHEGALLSHQRHARFGGPDLLQGAAG
jgi:hypothetical protein